MISTLPKNPGCDPAKRQREEKIRMSNKQTDSKKILDIDRLRVGY